MSPHRGHDAPVPGPPGALCPQGPPAVPGGLLLSPVLQAPALWLLFPSFSQPGIRVPPGKLSELCSNDSSGFLRPPTAALLRRISMIIPTVGARKTWSFLPLLKVLLQPLHSALWEEARCKQCPAKPELGTHVLGFSQWPRLPGLGLLQFWAPEGGPEAHRSEVRAEPEAPIEGPPPRGPGPRLPGSPPCCHVVQVPGLRLHLQVELTRGHLEVSMGC